MLVSSFPQACATEMFKIHKYATAILTETILKQFWYCFVDYGCAQFGHPNWRFV